MAWLLKYVKSVAKYYGVICLASATTSVTWTPCDFVEPPVEWLLKRINSIAKDYGVICLASATTSVACVNKRNASTCVDSVKMEILDGMALVGGFQRFGPKIWKNQ